LNAFSDYTGFYSKFPKTMKDRIESLERAREVDDGENTPTCEALWTCAVDLSLKQRKQPGIIPDLEIPLRSVSHIEEVYRECKFHVV